MKLKKQNADLLSSNFGIVIMSSVVFKKVVLRQRMLFGSAWMMPIRKFWPLRYRKRDRMGQVSDT
jgi:hypothetical protein